MNYNLGNIRDWSPIGSGELIELAGGKQGYRSIQFELMAPDTCEIYAVGEDWTTLVGYGAGMISCRFAVQETCALMVSGPEGATFHIRLGREPQVISQSGCPSFTRIEPKRAGPTDELRRMMHMVQLNSQNREKALLEQVKRLTAGVTKPAEGAEAAAVPPSVQDTAEVIEKDDDAVG